MNAKIRLRLIFALCVLAFSTAAGRAHQIQNGSFESGINPAAPSADPRVAADPGDPNVTSKPAAQPFTAAFVGPMAGGTFKGSSDAETMTGPRPGGSGPSNSQPGGGQFAQGPGSGGNGSAGGGGGGNSAGLRSSNSGPMASLMTATADSLYPEAETPTPLDEIAEPNQPTIDTVESTGFVLEKAPVWVASNAPNQLAALTGSGFDGSPSGSFGIDALAAGPIHQNPAPPGVVLGLLAVGPLVVRFRRQRRAVIEG